jgi:glutathione S-transferase
MMYQLYYSPGNASIAVHILLAAIRKTQPIDYELKLVDRDNNWHKSAEYMQLNPTGRIPTFIDTNPQSNSNPQSNTNDQQPLVIFESVAICQYLLDKHPQVNLQPDRASALNGSFYQWLMYLNSTVQSEILLHFYPDRYTRDKDTAPAISAMAELRVTEMFELLDKQLAGVDYLVGDQLSLCDIFLFMIANWASGFNKAPLTMPNLSRYLKQLAQLPLIKETYLKEGKNIDHYF